MALTDSSHKGRRWHSAALCHQSFICTCCRTDIFSVTHLDSDGTFDMSLRSVLVTVVS